MYSAQAVPAGHVGSALVESVVVEASDTGTVALYEFAAEDRFQGQAFCVTLIKKF